MMPKTITVRLTFTEDADERIYKLLSRTRTTDRSRILYQLVARGEVAGVIHDVQQAEAGRIDALTELAHAARTACETLTKLGESLGGSGVKTEAPEAESSQSKVVKEEVKPRRGKPAPTKAASSSPPPANAFDALINGCFAIKPSVD